MNIKSENIAKLSYKLDPNIFHEHEKLKLFGPGICKH